MKNSVSSSSYKNYEEKQIDKQEKDNEMKNEQNSFYQSFHHSNIISENQLIPRYITMNNHKYVIRPVHVLLSVNEFADCKYVSNLMQTICFRVGLLAVFDVFTTAEECICFLNGNEYDIVFVHQDLLTGNQGESFIINLQYLLSYTPVIVMGLSNNYGFLMSLCDFSAFLRLPFSTSDFLHYLLKYAFEIYEAKMLNTELQKISKKDRLRYQIMNNVKKLPESNDYPVVGIPVVVSLDDKTTIDDYIQKSRFKIPNCYQIPISSVSNIIGLNTKKVSENMPIPLVSPNEQVSTDILLNSNDKSSCNLFQSSNSPLTKNQLMDNSCILESNNYQQHNNTNLSLNEEARNDQVDSGKEEEVKQCRKRITCGKKLVREKVDEFVNTCSVLYSKMNKMDCTAFPISCSNSNRYVSIAPKT